MAAKKITRAAVKKALLLRLERNGLLDAENLDLVEQYLQARDRLGKLNETFEDAEDEAISQGTDAIAKETATMVRLLDVMGLTPESKRRKEIEQEIRDQLKAKGLKGPVFDDRVAQFMALWDAFQDANKNLKERGRSYFTTSSSGKVYEKDNTASRDIVTLAKAMQDLLDNMEITVKGYTNPDDDEL
jgi:hypothetical protein